MLGVFCSVLCRALMVLSSQRVSPRHHRVIRLITENTLLLLLLLLPHSSLITEHRPQHPADAAWILC